MSNVKNPQVQYLLKRMELVGSDEFTPSRGGRATIYFKDGTHATNTTYLLGHEIDIDAVSYTHLVPVQALIHTVEHLRRRKGIDQLRSQIIDDQKVAVQDISGPVLRLIVIISIKPAARQNIEHIRRCQIDNGIVPTDQFSRDAVAQK